MTQSAQIAALKTRARSLALEARHAHDFERCARLQRRANALARKAFHLENLQRSNPK